MSDWIIAGTRNCNDYLKEGVDILANGGKAIDAVETVIKGVEANPYDWSVGYNGFPNLLGEVELDASIMQGSTRQAGAVAGIKGFKHPISIARYVMEKTPHVLLVGEGAELFAKSIGFTKETSLSDDSTILFQKNIIEGKEDLKGLEVPQQVRDLAWRYDQYLKRQLDSFDYKKWYTKLSHEFQGTVNVIAKDIHGEICCGVSTSGLALKFPGRAGDSPLIGAGNYCDLRYGAAVCVGNGELAIRLGMAHRTVNYMQELGSVQQAVERSINDLLELGSDGVIQVLAMDQDGNVAACANQALHYVVANQQDPNVRRIDTTLTNGFKR
ncbi:MAG: isoaspartyl peptidase/L-asparaginase [Candidatus Kariarchaeaceae archaeon]